MFVNHGGLKYGKVNCGLCTVAGILETTSSSVAKMLGFPQTQSEQSFAAAFLKREGKDLSKVRLTPDDWQNYSLAGMKQLVKAVMNHLKSECYISQGGSWDTLVPMRVQKGLMDIYPIGTQYAIYGCMEMKGWGAHWNYAIRTDSGVEFRDYQYNDSEDNPAKISDSFIPPKGSGESSGSYVMAIVLVFRSIRHLR